MARKKIKILLVDDAPSTLEEITLLLQKLGHEVVTATNGGRAVATIIPGGVIDPSFDAIISDCKMPGESGVWLLQFLNHSRVYLPFLLHSTEPAHREHGHEFNLKDFVEVFDFMTFHLKSDKNYIEAFLKKIEH